MSDPFLAIVDEMSHEIDAVCAIAAAVQGLNPPAGHPLASRSSRLIWESG
jgi:hypothetical protein